jgi:hypothetical protein
MWRTFFDAVIMTEVKRRPLCPAEGVALRRDRRFAGRLLHVRELFEERNTGTSSLRRGRGLLCRFRRGCESIGDWAAASARLLLQLLSARLRSHQLPCLSPRLSDL